MLNKYGRRGGRRYGEGHGAERSYWPRPVTNWQELAEELSPMTSWDLSSVTRIQRLSLHTNDVNGVAFSSNLQLATASSDKTAQICQWKVGSGFTHAFSLKEHKYSVTSVEWSPYGSLLATGSVDGTVILWDVTSGERLTSFVQPGNAAVRTCNFSIRANYLLSAGDSGSVNIWDINHLATKKLTISFQHGDEAIYGASFCPADLSGYLVSGCGAGLLCLWDAGASTTHNKPLTSYENAHDSGVTCVSFAPTLVSSDGGLLKQCLMVTGGQDHLVKLWTVTLGLDFDIEPLRTLDAHSASVFCVRIGVNGLIASASSDKTVRLWNIAGKCVKVLEGHDRYVTSCGFSKDGRLLASGSNDKTVIIWDLTGSIKLNEDIMTSLNDFSLTTQDLWPQYERLCKSRMQQEKSVNLKASFEIPMVDFNSCLIIGSSNIILAASSSAKCLFAWNTDTKTQIDLSGICFHKDFITGIQYSPSLQTLTSISGDGSINLYNAADINTIKKSGGFYHPSGSALRVCRFSPDGSLMLVGSEDEQASLWNMKTNAMVKQFTEHTAVIFAAAFSPGGQYVVTGCSNGWFKLWDCQDEEKTASVSTQKGTHELGVTSCDFSPNGLGGTRGQHRLLLVSGGNDSLVKLWQVTIGHGTASFTLWQTFADHGTHINVMCVAFCPSGKLLASCAENIRLWDVSTGTCIQVIEGHSRYVTSIGFSSDGSQLVSCSGDHSVKVWDLKNDLACKTGASENLAIENMISNWTSENVVNWLAEIGLGDLGHIFESKEISGIQLIHLNDTLLCTDLGIEEENTRKQLLTELQWLKSLGMSSKQCMSKSDTIAVPHEFFCPITHDIFAEPVICADGNTYELAAIKAWFLMGRTTSPLTNQEIVSLNLTPNFELQNRISEFLAQRLNTP